MKEENDILKRIDRHDGMTVPPGFFADFATRMADSLEVTDFERSALPDFKPKPLTFWQRVRPYVYLAAMFAGIWCMLKLFTTLTAVPADPYSMTPALADALNDDNFLYQYVIDDIDQWDIMDEMYEDGISFDELEYDGDDNPDNTQSLPQ